MKKLLNNQKNHFTVFLFVLIFCMLLLFGRLIKTGSAIGGDAVYYYSTLRSLAIDNDLNFNNEYQYFHQTTSTFTGNRKIPQIPSENSQTKKLPAKYPIGTAILLLPSFFIAHILINADGYNIIYQAVAALSSLLYTFIGLILIYQLGKKLFNSKISFLATLGIWLATPLVYYMTMEPLNSQSSSFFSVSLFIYLWFFIRKSKDLKHWIILGIVGGLMSMVRYQDSLFILIPVMDVILLKVNVFKVLIVLISAAITMIPQFLANNYLFGSPFITGYQNDGFLYLFAPKIFYSLISLQRGILVWSPILIFALIGIYLFFRKSRAIGFLLIISFLIQLYIVSSWVDPSQGDSFGNRILINSNIIFAIGLMQFLKNTLNYQKVILTLFSLLILSNGLLAGLFVFRIIGQPY